MKQETSDPCWLLIFLLHFTKAHSWSEITIAITFETENARKIVLVGTIAAFETSRHFGLFPLGVEGEKMKGETEIVEKQMSRVGARILKVMGETPPETGSLRTFKERSARCVSNGNTRCKIMVSRDGGRLRCKIIRESAIECESRSEVLGFFV